MARSASSASVILLEDQLEELVEIERRPEREPDLAQRRADARLARERRLRAPRCAARSTMRSGCGLGLRGVTVRDRYQGDGGRAVSGLVGSTGRVRAAYLGRRRVARARRRPPCRGRSSSPRLTTRRTTSRASSRRCARPLPERRHPRRRRQLARRHRRDRRRDRREGRARPRHAPRRASSGSARPTSQAFAEGPRRGVRPLLRDGRRPLARREVPARLRARARRRRRRGHRLAQHPGRRRRRAGASGATSSRRAGSLYSRTILGLGVKDLTSGYKAFTRRALEAIDLAERAARTATRSRSR